MPNYINVIDLALVRSGLESEVMLVVVQWLLYLFASLANMAATIQLWRLLSYCDRTMCNLAVNGGSN